MKAGSNRKRLAGIQNLDSKDSSNPKSRPAVWPATQVLALKIGEVGRSNTAR